MSITICETSILMMELILANCWMSLMELGNKTTMLFALKELLYRMGQSDQIKSYFNKMNVSLVLIGKCFVLLVFLVGMVFLSDYLITSIIQ